MSIEPHDDAVPNGPNVPIVPPYLDDSDLLDAEEWDDLDSAVWLAQRGWEHPGFGIDCLAISYAVVIAR